MAVPEQETPPDNQSPETMEEEIDLDQAVGDAIDRKFSDEGFLAKLKGVLTEPPKQEDPKPPTEPEPAPEPPKEPAPAGAAAGAPAPVQDVKSAVREVLAEQDHEKEHQALTHPAPKPPRKGIAAAVFGAERK